MIPILLGVISFITHFAFWSKPAAVVFDEMYFGDFVSNYLTGKYFFDIHPPLGKLIITFFASLTGNIQTANFSTISNYLPHEILMWRIVPTFAGFLLPIVIYYICRSINLSRSTSFIAGLLICFENSIIVQSRFILLDSMLLLFGFSAFLFYFLYRKNRIIKYKCYLYLFVSIFLSACALSVKWTGLSFVFLISLMEIWSIYGESLDLMNKFKKSAIFIAISLIISATVYLSVFAIHFSYFTYQKAENTLSANELQTNPKGNEYDNHIFYESGNFWAKFSKLNWEMFDTNANLEATHPYSSSWYTWPLMKRPIFYYGKYGVDTDGSLKKSYIYFIGNPLIYWLGTITMIVLIPYTLWLFFIKKRNIYKDNLPLTFITIGYLLNLLPFMLISRIMFLYHYQTSLVFSIIAIAFVFDKIKSSKVRLYLSVTLLFIAISLFIFFAPLTYGVLLTYPELLMRMLLSSWM